MCTRFQSKDSIPLTKARLLNFPRNSPAFQQFLYDWNSVEKTALSLDGTAAVWDFSIGITAQLNVELSQRPYCCVGNVPCLGRVWGT